MPNGPNDTLDTSDIPRREIVVIYNGEDACTQCEGWKRVASGDDPVTWKAWAEIPPPSNLAVQLGMVYPVTCPRCEGTGIEPKED